jgi:hypothetical protein
MNAAKLENSNRLKRVAWHLSDNKKHSTREISHACNVQAVGSTVSELRSNGFDIECKRIGEYFYYKMVGGFTNLLRMVK